MSVIEKLNLILDLVKERNVLRAALQELREAVDSPPPSSCSCHISPPCNDCVDYRHLRYALAQAEEAFHSYTLPMLEEVMPLIHFKKNHPDAVLPTKGTEHAAAFDLVAVSVEDRGNSAIVDTGLSVAFPEGYVLLLFSRSGHAAKHDIRLTNCVGVIDADYRGPLKVLLTQDNQQEHPLSIGSYVRPGERVAQAILMQLPQTEWLEVAELPDSVRGEGGFGSTGTS